MKQTTRSWFAKDRIKLQYTSSEAEIRLTERYCLNVLETSLCNLHFPLTVTTALENLI